MKKTHYTLGLIKPLTIKQGLHFNILKDIESIGQIVQMKRFTFSKELASNFYESLSHLPFYDSLVKNMSSDDSIGFILSGDENIVLKYRELMGATNPADAKQGSLRFIYAKSIDNNAVHGSDSTENAKREINLIFPEFNK